MRYGRFEQQGRIFFGIVDGDSVQELTAAPWEDCRQTGRRHALAALKTLVPCIPANFYCAGLNYLEHLEWGNKRKGTSTRPPPKADVGYRSVNALIATGETIVIPADSPGPVHVRGRARGRHRQEGAQPVRSGCAVVRAGLHAGQRRERARLAGSDRTLWRAKNCDTFKPWARTSRPASIR